MTYFQTNSFKLLCKYIILDTRFSPSVDKSSEYFCRGRSNRLSLINWFARTDKRQVEWDDMEHWPVDSVLRIDCPRRTITDRCRHPVILGSVTINDFPISFDNTWQPLHLSRHLHIGYSGVTCTSSLDCLGNR